MRRVNGRLGTKMDRLAWLFGLGLALAPAACGPSGVGSVDFDKPPDAKAIGAAPRSETKVGDRPRRAARSAPKKTMRFEPG